MISVVYEEGWQVTCERCGHEFLAAVADPGRLEAEVVRAAREWLHERRPQIALKLKSGRTMASDELWEAVEALEAFEAEQEK